MKLNSILYSIAITLTLLLSIDVFGQDSKDSGRTIFLMRAKQFYGSGAKMNLMINGELFNELKSGNRLIIKSNSNDTLSLQVVYPLIKGHKSHILKVSPDGESEVYIDLFYWGEGYNPLKHAGLIRGPHGVTPEFNIEVIRMTQHEGKVKFEQSENYKDNGKIKEKILP